jgi:acyl-CoA reductase-like NAD-dependent aldehyde dehydrogenase
VTADPGITPAEGMVAIDPRPASIWDRAARRARVERVVAAGARLADPRDPLGEEVRRRLPGTTGLSREGVELALTRHLETSATDEDLDALLSRCARARRCHVVLAANVCTAAQRALAVATATSPCVLLRPSRRDPVVAELLSRALQGDALFARWGGSVELIAELDLAGAEPGQAQGDIPAQELHIHGTDETVAALRTMAGARAVVRGHGAGLGVAVIGAQADLPAAAQALADDVVPFDQRGCLSPRFALVEGTAARAEDFARALHGALGGAGARVPRGPLDDAVRAGIAMYQATLEALGSFFRGDGHGVGLDPTPRSLPLPPAARVVHVAASSAEAARSLLAPWGAVITAIGTAGGGPLAQAAWSAAPRARRSTLGDMQRPPLDGPVDLRAF